MALSTFRGIQRLASGGLLRGEQRRGRVFVRHGRHGRQDHDSDNRQYTRGIHAPPASVWLIVLPFPPVHQRDV